MSSVIVEIQRLPAPLLAGKPKGAGNNLEKAVPGGVGEFPDSLLGFVLEAILGEFGDEILDHSYRLDTGGAGMGSTPVGIQAYSEWIV